MKIARVFPRRTKATPDDPLAFTGPPPKGGLPDIEEVHVSVAFTYDMEKACQLAEQWMKLGVPVHMGGPANLLACSRQHIEAVFEMLGRQKERPAFTGGLEARLLRPWHVDLLRESRTQRMYFAYDTPDDYEPLVEAGRLLQAGGFERKSHKACCYVLIGYRGDTMEAAEKRLRDAWKAGFIPYAMLYRDEKGIVDSEWRKFQRLWVRPAIVMSQLKESDGR